MLHKRRFAALLVCGLVCALPQIWAFTTSSTIPPKKLAPPKSLVPPVSIRREETNHKRTLCAATTTTKTDASTILESYEYDGWKLTYRTMANDQAADEDSRNVLLIHPVGIGLASWFWEPLLKALGSKSPKIRAYAPNLIGCGISEGSDAWDPNERGLFVPLGWVKGCEALIQQLNCDRWEGNQKWTIVTQGGLAPIGVLLAARNPELVDKLVLTSPPTWKDMTNAVPMEELERNYNFLKSPILGRLAFRLLETRSLIEFFSNQFLFSHPCDETWLDKTEAELCVAARPPVQNFNAGMCLNKSLEPQLRELSTQLPSVVVVQGANDKRPRDEYEEHMENCKIVTIPNTTNVVPWEDPNAMAEFLVETIES